MELADFIAFQSVTVGKYLVYNDQSTTATLHDILQFSGDKSDSEYARFKVEKDINDGSLVNIKSTYNNKYWRTASQGSSWVVATAEEKQVDKTMWSCTLFKPEALPSEPGDKYPRYRFSHVKLKNFIVPLSDTDVTNALSAAQSVTPSDDNVFFVITLPG